ncbi:hypothetical protein [Rubellicoccus peritrichatus]|uniref:Uncharacterized protein n=1 Tax=Rubellicoccus peritrichatus TaxID=3080537 RepID=A0AAQ3LAR3_9BACT|nr:hypothetical protein [Puniceicoccus sp. CR14]WOO40777.1 hypothetical protein RZN69_19310 [Puniceicoccus sp. CR14]
MSDTAACRQREAVILIHGMDGKTSGDILAKMERGILSSGELTHKQSKPDHSLGEHEARVLEVKTRQDPENIRELHLFEAFWGDTITALTKRPIKEQILRGLILIFYWGHTPVSKTKNRYIAYCGLITTLAMLFWWYGAVTSSLNVLALPSGKSFSDLVSNATSDMWFPFAFLGCLISDMTQWWLSLTTLLFGGSLAIVIESAVNILGFAYRYLTDDNLRQGIWKRVSGLILEIEASGEYERITIVSHSFGTVIHVDFMADYAGSSGTSMRHITLAGPLAVMALRAQSIRQRMSLALSSPVIRKQSWVDFYSDADWMCTAMPDSSSEFSFETQEFKDADRTIDHRTIEFEDVHLLRKFFGAYHTRYFREPEVIEEILTPIAPIN